MRSLYILSTLLFLINNLSFANGKGFKSSISGIVKDAETQLPLNGATLMIPELKQSTTTDENGSYIFAGLPNGKITIQVSYVGYKSEAVTIWVNNNTHFDFLLQPTVVENENITVTGVAAATTLKRTPMQVSVLTHKAIEQSMGMNLLDAISKESGVSVLSTGPAIAKPFIRGLGFNRIVTINDGMRLEGQQWGDEHGIEVDEYSTQKVEILRGPASLMYGSDAIGGVINIISNPSTSNRAIRANLQTTFNGNSRLWGQYANVAGNLNGLNWNLYGSIKSSGDYKNKYDGYVLNSRFNEKNMGGFLGVNRSWGYSHLIFSRFNQNPGLVEGERDEKGNLILDGYEITEVLKKGRKPLVPSQAVYHTKVALDNSFFFKNTGKLMALIGVQQNKRKEFATIDTPDDAEIYLNLSTINYNTSYQFPQKNNWKTSMGVNGMQQQNKNRGVEIIIPDYDLFDLGVFVVSSKTWSRTTVSGGLRFDFRALSSNAMLEGNSNSVESFSKKYANLSGSLGATHAISDQVFVKLNLSRGFRAPNISELAVHGVHEGSNRYEIGDRNLKSEVSATIDGSIELTTNHVNFSIAPYVNYIDNYIFYNRLLSHDGTDSLTDGVPTFQFRQQSARLMGFEARLDIHPHPWDWLHFENRVSFVRGRFVRPVDGSYNLPLIAPANLFTELRGELPSLFKSFSKAYAKVEMNWVAAQNHYFSGYDTETATKGYILLNVGVGADMNISKQNKISIMFGVNNIGDVVYQSHLSRLKYTDTNPQTGRTGVFNMGRNFMARIIIPFEWKV